ncbi:MAG: PilZ domain-containing protein [Gammaproteobacteria bacterium]|nr:MAG: PilZ domain-containing protein [Gammaproteobacteria bacterium]
MTHIYDSQYFIKVRTLKLNNPSQSERRIYNRIPFTAEILMQSGSEEWSCNLLDISLKGMLVEPPENIDINLSNPCGMALFLGEDIAIHARVSIIRSDDNNWGLKWLQIDVNSLQHLRHLIELNVSNPAMLMRELSELG